MARLKRHRAFSVILALYLTLALLYGVTIPIFETPDANGHYAYIHELTESRGFPVQGTPSGERVTGYVASHPPVYYSLVAALTFWIKDDVELAEWSWRNPYQTMGDASRTVNKNRLVHTPAEHFPWRGTPLTMHIARLVSTALGMVAVVAVYGIATELFPDWRWLALGATALAAFNPMFIFTSARVSNDAAVTAFGSLAIWGAVRLAARGLPPKGLLLTGAALGLAALSKLSGVVLAPAVGLALLFDSLREWHERQDDPVNQRLKTLGGRWALVVGTAALVSGWWFARNLILYDELMGVDAWLSHTATVRAQPIGVLQVIPELGGLEKSYWAMFGWFNIAAAPWMYVVWRVVTRLSILGLVLVTFDQFSPRKFTRPVQQGLLVLTFALLLNVGSVWRFIMIVFGAQGRYLMPTTAAISILIMLGMSRLLGDGLSLDRWRRTLAALMGGGQCAMAVISLFAFILPAYAKPAIVHESELPRDMSRLNLSFGQTPIELLGGHIEAEAAHPGDTLSVSLYWRAQEKPEEEALTFVQILGRDKEAVSGVDCYPGRGTFPPSLWEANVIYRDRYELRLPLDTEVPTAAALYAGLYDENRTRLPVTRPPDDTPLDMMLLDLIPVRPVEPASANAAHEVGARLDGAITLVGYDVSETEVHPGEAISVTLVWQAEKTLNTDHTAFLHLIDGRESLVSQSDHPPLDGAFPTSFWIPEDVVRDPHRLQVERTARPGRYLLMAGMYESQTRHRLPAFLEEGAHRPDLRIEDDAVVIGHVTVR